MVGAEFVPFLQLALALLLGMVIGLERSLARKGAGMRTFGLVSLGSCFFVLIPSLIESTGLPDFDPFRVSAAVITGIGFLGGGIIIYDRELKGLTTAAGLWVSAGVGIGVAFGLYAAALFTTFLTLFAFTVMWYVERYIANNLELPNRIYDDLEPPRRSHR